jgi:hypothetical protein
MLTPNKKHKYIYIEYFRVLGGHWQYVNTVKHINTVHICMYVQSVLSLFSRKWWSFYLHVTYFLPIYKPVSQCSLERDYDVFLRWRAHCL